jgi:hypothetical protein
LGRRQRDPEREEASMKSKRQTTMAKRAREQLVRERRALKLEKKQATAKAARKAETADEGGGPAGTAE